MKSQVLGGTLQTGGTAQSHPWPDFRARLIAWIVLTIFLRALCFAIIFVCMHFHGHVVGCSNIASGFDASWQSCNMKLQLSPLQPKPFVTQFLFSIFTFRFLWPLCVKHLLRISAHYEEKWSGNIAFLSLCCFCCCLQMDGKEVLTDLPEELSLPIQFTSGAKGSSTYT